MVNIVSLLRDKKQNIVIWTIFFMIFHGEMVFNKISWHDDIYVINGWFDGLGHGRFTEYLMTITMAAISGTESLPVVHCLIAAFCVSVTGILILEIFEIRQPIARVGIMIVCLSIPALTGNMGYMGTFGYNMIGVLLTVMAAYYAISYEDVLHTIVAIVLFAFAIGEYQCYITLYLSVLLCAVFKLVMNSDIFPKEIFKTIIRYAITAIGGLILYIILLRIFLFAFHQELSDYANINTFGIGSFDYYRKQVLQIYTNDLFTKPTGLLFDMFPFHWLGWHKIMMVLFGLGSVLVFIQLLREHRFIHSIFLALAFVSTPTIFCFDFVMYNMRYTHSLHMYHYIMLFVLVFMLMEQGLSYVENLLKYKTIKKIRHIGGIAVASFLLLVGCMYVRYDNICYMSAEMEQQQAISYFTCLISDIHNTAGYYAEIPVCYINDQENRSISNHSMSFYDEIITNPYNKNLASLGAWKAYMYAWCNYKPASEVYQNELDEDVLLKIKDMSRYPDNGSIKVIDDVLYVKF